MVEGLGFGDLRRSETRVSWRVKARHEKLAKSYLWYLAVFSDDFDACHSSWHLPLSPPFSVVVVVSCA